MPYTIFAKMLKNVRFLEKCWKNCENDEKVEKRWTVEKTLNSWTNSGKVEQIVKKLKI
jgi:hypothetical protein